MLLMIFAAGLSKLYQIPSDNLLFLQGKDLHYDRVNRRLYIHFHIKKNKHESGMYLQIKEH